MIRSSVLFVGLLVVPAMALARPAQGPGRDSGGSTAQMQPDRPRPNRPQPLRVAGSARDPQCLKDCGDELKLCMSEGRDDSAACFDECQPLRDAAREACSADSESAECEEAREALHDCIQPCREALAPVLKACAEEGLVCVDECPVIDDPQCFEACKSERAACLRGTSEDGQTCYAECLPPLAAALVACHNNHEADICIAAREVVLGCLDACKNQLREGIENCAEGFRGCGSSCVTEPSVE